MRSLGELFALAHALEQEAAERYQNLALRMQELELPEVAAVFRHLAAEEQGHVRNVDDWSRKILGTEPRPELIQWQPPETFDEEEAREIASSQLASAYRALSMAVRNEERAFALWTYIAAQAEAPDVQAAAERMAREELGHAALLRRERRRAFHAARSHTAPFHEDVERPSPLDEAVPVERRLAALLLSLAEGAMLLKPHAAELRRLGEEAAVLGGTMPESVSVTAGPEGDEWQTMRAAQRLAEQAVELYLDAAARATEEEEVGRAQSKAGQAIARSAALRGMTSAK